MKVRVIAALFPFSLLATAQENKFIVEGKINGYDAPAKIYLQFIRKEKTFTDSATLKGGRFRFSGKAGEEPVSAYLSVNPKGNGVTYTDYRQLYLEKGDISIYGDSLKTATVNGDRVNSDNERYAAMTSPVNAEDEALAAKINAETPEQQRSDSYQREISHTQHDIDRRSLALNEQFVRENPSSYISLMALGMCEAYGADYAVIAPLHDRLNAQIRQTETGRQFAAILTRLKAVAVGSPGSAVYGIRHLRKPGQPGVF